MSKLKRIVYIVVGCIGVGLGAVVAVVPLLPAFPFLMLAAVCFARSSEKLNNWFKSTKLYKNNLESFVKGEGMPWAAKIRIMILVTALMAFGFFMMFRKDLFGPCIILGCVWVFHIVLFSVIIKTKKTQEKECSH